MSSQKSIFITGGSRGIGLAIVEKFLENNWNVGFCSQNEKSVLAALEHLKEKYPNTTIWAKKADLQHKEEALNLAEEAYQFFGKIDIWVNNAGKYTPGNISEPGFSDKLAEMLNINLMSAYWVGKIVVPKMKAQKSGTIANISSIAGLQAYPGGGSYAIAKHALTGYTRTLRLELKDQNIKVVGIYPGATYTDSWAESNLPKARFIAASDIANILFSFSQLSPSAVIEDIIIRPQLGDI